MKVYKGTPTPTIVCPIVRVPELTAVTVSVVPLIEPVKLLVERLFVSTPISPDARVGLDAAQLAAVSLLN
jgi:hypothetical protein